MAVTNMAAYQFLRVYTSCYIISCNMYQPLEKEKKFRSISGRILLCLKKINVSQYKPVISKTDRRYRSADDNYYDNAVHGSQKRSQHV